MGAQHKIKTDYTHARYYRRYWLELRDGGSDEWLYVCQDAGDVLVGGWRFFFIELLDIPAACGRDAQDRWACGVDIVDLLEANAETVGSALRSCGFDDPDADDFPDMKTLKGRLAMAEIMRYHGAAAPVWSDSGGKVTFDDYGNCNDDYNENCPAFRRLRKEAAEFVEAKLLDHESCEHVLNTKIVNEIGQTAREYAQGTSGLWESLRRIKTAGDEATPGQKLVLKMYSNCEHTLGAGPIPEDIRRVQTDDS